MEIQATASRVLGEYIGANRVAYFEVRGADYVVERDYVNGASALAGSYPIDSFGPKLLAAYRTGCTVSVFDVEADPNLSPDQQAAYAAIQIGAYIGIPLVKEGEFVAGLAIHTSGSRAWTPDEVILAEEVADRTWATVERVRAEARVRESEEKLSLFVKHTPAAMAMFDCEMRYLGHSQRWMEDYKLTENIIGRSHYEVFPEIPESWKQIHQNCLAGAVEKSDEDSFYRIDGSVDWLKWEVRPWFKAAGEVGGIVIFAENITERKQAQIQLQRQASKLIELNAALEQTASKLRERNQELDRFVYTVSHDLKAPLRAIYNLSSWIADDLQGQLNEENLHQMQLLQSRVLRMEALINGLLAYSRIGRTEIVTERVKVGELLSEILDSLMFPSTFTIFVQSAMPTLFTKKLLLSQVFSNLISNAIKYNDRLDGRIEIRANQKGEYYEFSVADNGPGIAPENHERVFEIFQTLQGQEVPESTGIGLSIVKKIIETEGGLIILESNLGEGATFRFTWGNRYDDDSHF
ncbi:sensor histidine kinase [Aphanothece hegewaldii]|uniref:sensor histidine kinase n=1 Tax=Aphanothece hegewaldii TaxID=1521625 RepID=UPI002481986F|nr:ATP-binding protein [Aphanothece hegewaldii]